MPKPPTLASGAPTTTKRGTPATVVSVLIATEAPNSSPPKPSGAVSSAVWVQVEPVSVYT